MPACTDELAATVTVVIGDMAQLYWVSLIAILR
jgi:hypothetical protein